MAGIECSPKIFDFRASGIPVQERVDFFDTLSLPLTREVARRKPRRKEFTPSVSLRSTAPSQREPLYKGAFVFRFIPAACGRRGSAGKRRKFCRTMRRITCAIQPCGNAGLDMEFLCEFLLHYLPRTVFTTAAASSTVTVWSPFTSAARNFARLSASKLAYSVL